MPSSGGQTTRSRFRRPIHQLRHRLAPENLGRDRGEAVRDPPPDPPAHSAMYPPVAIAHYGVHRRHPGGDHLNEERTRP